MNNFDDSDKPRYMDTYEVVQGALNSLEDLEGDWLADIAGIQYILPAEIGLKIQSRIGQQVSIIHLGHQEYKLKLVS